MNLLFGSPLWLMALLLVALSLAAIEDAARLRISNLTCAFVALCALAAMLVSGLSVSMWQNLAVFAAILALGTAAFAGGWLGGGDVKLFAAVGLWVDFYGAVWLIAAIFMAGGIIAIAYVAMRALRRTPLKLRRRRIPYGVGIAAGALIATLMFREASAHHRPYSLPHVTAPGVDAQR